MKNIFEGQRHRPAIARDRSAPDEVEVRPVEIHVGIERPLIIRRELASLFVGIAVKSKTVPQFVGEDRNGIELIRRIDGGPTGRIRVEPELGHEKIGPHPDADIRLRSIRVRPGAQLISGAQFENVARAIVSDETACHARPVCRGHGFIHHDLHFDAGGAGQMRGPIGAGREERRFHLREIGRVRAIRIDEGNVIDDGSGGRFWVAKGTAGSGERPLVP